ncbi:MAG: NAD(P)-dependent oxidoreductase [Hyphomicrobiales bacterium]|nr:NAD(P)-dependent oxidoreductase [Hyphomicrobiales bacterium]
MAEFSLGIVGLGTMGGPIAKRLENEGFAPQVADPNPQTLQYYVAQGGASPAATPLNLAQLSQVILLVLPDDAALREAVSGPNGIIHGLKPNALVIDMSGTAPQTGAALSRALVSQGAHWVEAVPVGSPKDAVAGSLKILVAGRTGPVERAMPVLEALADQVIRTGPVGTAALAKSLAGALAGLNLVATVEAMIVCKRLGLQPQAAIEVLTTVSPTPGALPDAFAEQVLSRRFGSGYSLAGLLRDIDRIQDAARHSGTPAPLLAATREIFAAAKLNVETSDDHTEVVRWLERIAKTELDAGAPD